MVRHSALLMKFSTSGRLAHLWKIWTCLTRSIDSMQCVLIRLCERMMKRWSKLGLLTSILLF